MKALLLEAYGRFSYTDMPDPELSNDDVLVRVERCGICGSDVHGMDGSSGRRIPPVIMGHEASGVVCEVGGRVSDYSVGERVTFDSTVYCGSCRFCSEGRVNLCERREVLGVSCDEYRRHGAFADYVAVPARTIYRLPDAVSFDQAALVEPISIAMHATELAGNMMSRRVVVIGAGVIGTCITSLVVASGCASCVVIDPDASRRARAMRIGADAAVDPAEGVDASGEPADLVFEAVGIPATVEASLQSVRKGGTVVLVGNITPRVEFGLQSVVTREIAVLGSCGSAGEYPMCLSLLERGMIPVDEMISQVAPLASGAGWFERLAAGESGLLKVLLVPEVATQRPNESPGA